MPQHSPLTDPRNGGSVVDGTEERDPRSAGDRIDGRGRNPHLSVLADQAALREKRCQLRTRGNELLDEVLVAEKGQEHEHVHAVSE